MDKSIAGLLAVAGVFAIPGAQAASAVPASLAAAMRVSSYADLLKPIPNAAVLLKASAAARVEVAPVEQGSGAEARVEQAQLRVYIGPPRRRRHHHHHHHHHHHQ